MIRKKDRIIEKPQFDVMFVYNECNKRGWVTVKRLSGGDTLQTISFWGGDRLKTLEQFKDVCTCWCDRNIA